MIRCSRRITVTVFLILSGEDTTSIYPFVASTAGSKESGPARNKNGGTRLPKASLIQRRFDAGRAAVRNERGAMRHGGHILPAWPKKQRDEAKLMLRA